MNDWVRALGIDYGTVRIGLAASDDLGFLAHPLETVPAGDPAVAAERIRTVVAERRIEDVVLGLPLRRDGSEGDAVGRVRHFRKHLESVLPAHIRWHEVDEFFSTVDAMEKLHAAGRNTKTARPVIDQAAAVEILQRWLDGRETADS